ncbi:MAG TPA: hypothetical protein VNU93_09255 [Verrucomicrobiae bacterium]|nr:hypothetical protein [Verrucomicrobiae bacterium]
MTYNPYEKGGHLPYAYPGGGMPPQQNYQGYQGVQAYPPVQGGQQGFPPAQPMQRYPVVPGGQGHSPGMVGVPQAGYPMGAPGGYGPGQLPYQANPGYPQASRRQGLVSKFANRQANQQMGMPNQPNMMYPGNMMPQGNQGAPMGRRGQFQNAMPQTYMQQPMIQPMVQPMANPMGKPIKPKQFTLTSAIPGLNATGVATIPDGNNFSLIINNLPDPAQLSNGQNGMYTAYLTNRKGQGAFAIGQLQPLGGGTYKSTFYSNVPFYDYEQVVVSLENPYGMQNFPTGPLVMTSSVGKGITMPKPVKNFFSGVWGKIKGIGKKDEPAAVPEMPQNLGSGNLLGNYNLGPTVTPTGMVDDLPGLGGVPETPPNGGNP